MTDKFVEGVVAADVFTDGEELACGFEEACGVEAAGGFEDVLVFAEEVGEGIEEGGGDFYRVLSFFGGYVQIFECRFATDAAAGACVRVTLGAGEVGVDGFGDGDCDGVSGDVSGGWGVACVCWGVVCVCWGVAFGYCGGNGWDGFGGDDAFGEEPADGEFFVVTGGAHGDGQSLLLAVGGRPVKDANFEGLFYGDGVEGFDEGFRRHFLDVETGDPGCGNCYFR